MAEPNEYDISTGYWIKGAQYYLIDDKRWYLSSYAPISKIRKTCKNKVVANAFRLATELTKNKPKDMYVEGKRYRYGLLKPEENVIIPMSPVVSPYYHELRDVQDKTYYMYHLICKMRDLTAPIDRKLFDAIECKPSCEGVCTKIGSKVAKSLIRIATERIFADPEQSIMEPIVNSVDAYYPETKVGKFGMGFFSFLYWLIGHPLRQLSIYSYTVENGIPTTFRVQIKELDKTLVFGFKIYDSSVLKTGTVIELDASKDPFDDDTLRKFNVYLYRTKYVQNVTITLVIDTSYITINKLQPIVNNGVLINIQKDVLRVEDTATGIPLSVVFGSLFIPSVSTKTIKGSPTSQKWKNASTVVRRIGIKEFHITVSDVVVVSLYDSELKEYDKIRLDLPPTTKIPVSRDDIILTEDIVPSMLESLNIITELCISTKPRSVISLQRYLSLYANKTFSSINSRIITTYIADMNKRLEQRYVEERYIHIYESLGLDIIASEYMVESAIVSFLDKNVKDAKTDIYTNYKVVFIDRLNEATTAGTNSYLFVGRDYIHKMGDKWIDLVAMSTYTSKLLKKERTKEIEQRNLDLISRTLSEHPFVGDVYNNVLNFIVTSIVNRWKVPKDGTASEKLYAVKIYNILSELCTVLDESKFGLEIYDDTIRHVISEVIDWFIYIPEYTGKLYEVLVRTLTKIRNAPKPYGSKKPNIKAGTWAFGEIRTKPTSNMKRITYETIKIGLESNLSTFPTYYIQSMNEPVRLHGSLYLYTPSNLVDKDLKLDIVDYLCSLTTTGEEFVTMSMVLSKLLYRIPKQPIRLLLQKKSVIKDIYRLVMEDQSMVNTMRTVSNYHIYSAISYIVNRVHVIAGTILTKYNVGTRYTTLYQSPPEYDRDPNVMYTKLSNIIETLFARDVTSFKELVSLSPRDLSPSYTNRFQILEIAINEGTTKSFYPAVITELVQNSIDAIREFDPKIKFIEISLSQNAKTLELVIKDYVGMSDSALISLSVPFLSTKTASEITTGEMGSGFFNVYRESSEVEVWTLKNGVVHHLLDTPIRKGDRVVDVERTVSIGTPKTTSFEGMTQITIRRKYNSNDDVENDISYIRTFVYNTIRPIDFPVFYNSQRLERSATLIYEDRFFKLIRIEGEYVPAYLYTKGVPFAELGSYLRDKDIIINELVDSLSNVIIDIKHKAYTPIQSRTRIIMEKETLEAFTNVVTMACYIAVLEQIKSSSYKDVVPITNYSSKARPIDMRLIVLKRPAYWVSVKFLLEHYTNDSIVTVSIAEMINRIIDKATDLGSAGDLIRKLVPKYCISEIRPAVIEALDGWFVEKDFSERETEVKEGETFVGIGEIATYYKPLYTFLTTWVRAYWNVGNKSGVIGMSEAPPTVIISVEDKKYDGLYRKGTNTIHLNYFWFDENLPSDRQDEVIAPYLTKSLDSVSKFLDEHRSGQRFLAFSNPTAILIHELEHARAKTIEAEGSHNDSSEQIIRNIPNRVLTFDERSINIQKHIMSNGFYDVLFSML